MPKPLGHTPTEKQKTQCMAARNRTPDMQIWRLPLYQLSYCHALRFLVLKWRGRKDSNLRRVESKSTALPTELHPS